MKIPRVPVTILNNGKTFRDTAMVIPEAKIRIRLNDRIVATVVCRPDNPEEPTVGLLLNHGIFSSSEVIKTIQVHPEEPSVSIHAQADEEALKAMIRFMAGSEEEVTSSIPARKAKPPASRASSPARGWSKKSHLVLTQVASQFRDIMEVKGIFGAYHVAAIADHRGRLVCQAGDIRTNVAVDRIFGRAFLAGLEIKNLVLLLSGRIEADAIKKAARHGIQSVMTFSVITHLALESALALNIDLIHARADQSLAIYGREAVKAISNAKNSAPEKGGAGINP